MPTIRQDAHGPYLKQKGILFRPAHPSAAQVGTAYHTPICFSLCEITIDGTKSQKEIWYPHGEYTVGKASKTENLYIPELVAKPIGTKPYEIALAEQISIFVNRPRNYRVMIMEEMTYAMSCWRNAINPQELPYECVEDDVEEFRKTHGTKFPLVAGLASTGKIMVRPVETILSSEDSQKGTFSGGLEWAAKVYDRVHSNDLAGCAIFICVVFEEQPDGDWKDVTDFLLQEEDEWKYYC